MCLIAVAHRLSPELPLVIAANRDEFYDRPARAAHVWEDDARVAGGRDLRAGGSWLAVALASTPAGTASSRRHAAGRRASGRRDGSATGCRFAAITNVRGARAADGPSRGLLVSDFVRGDAEALAYAQSLDRDAYAGFHLVVGDGTTIAHVTNAGDGPPAIIAPGSIFAVSNGRPGDDWPKVQLAREAMRSALVQTDVVAYLFDFLTTRRGGPLEQEVFVVSPSYGTRSSTVIVVDRGGAVTLSERVAPDGDAVRLRLPSRS